MHNAQYANKGKTFELIIKRQNDIYEQRKVANIQKISTPWNVTRIGKRIVSAFPEGKSTLDFRGTVKGGVSVSFDCKESEENGLPLKHIQPHQIDYIRTAMPLGEVSFILCYIKPLDKYYCIDGQTVLQAWDTWQANKGKRGYNIIPTDKMVEIKPSAGNICDYLPVVLRKE